MPPRRIELLAPAKNADIGIAAVSHGADAVYIGPEAFGARLSASNSIDEIRRLTDFAHQYRVRVYATVNTIIYPSELKMIERLCRELYRAGVDALIVQDMALLRLDLPPIELHASTQCDIRTPQKARFLQDVGFSQLVLARELTLLQVKAITESVDVPVETFVHGALCVSYSGRCHASQLCIGRSANRGNCAQMCRLPYTLTDAENRVLCSGKHLLSLHDLNLSDRLPQLLQAGVSSFKIEGRLKDADYVKNIVSYYRLKFDEIIAARPEEYARSSFGSSQVGFTPDPVKSFNRGFTHYFIDERRPANLTSPLTPKALGEPVHLADLHSGDGIAYFNAKEEYTGLRVNKVDGKRIYPFGNRRIPKGVELRRTFDRLFTEAVNRSNPVRRIGIDITLENGNAIVSDERGLRLIMTLPHSVEGVKNPAKIREIFGKLGNSIYQLRNFSDRLPDNKTYIPSALTAFRRKLILEFDRLNRITYPFGRRRSEDMSAIYPYCELTFADNVANTAAREFYLSHGVTKIEPAVEIQPHDGEIVAMTCRHCILREMNRCLQTSGGKGIRQPLTIESGPHRFTLRFNCKECEMELMVKSSRSTMQSDEKRNRS